MSIHGVATKIAAYLARELEADQSQESRMGFGLELLLGDLVKLVCILTLAYLLGILVEVFVIMMTASMLRLASGGEHCSAYYRCLLGGVICFLLLGCLVQHLNVILSTAGILISSGVAFIISVFILWRYAPGDTENKPITDAAEKKRFKQLSLIIAAIYLGIMLDLAIFPGTLPLVLPIAIGMLEQSFTVSPWGYRFMHLVDRLLDFSKWGGRFGRIESTDR